MSKLRNKILKFSLENVIIAFYAIRVIYNEVIGFLIYLTNHAMRVCVCVFKDSRFNY